MCVCVPANVRTYLRCEARAMIIHIRFVSRSYERSFFLYQKLSKYLSVFMKMHKNYKSAFGQFLVPFWVAYGPQNGPFWGPNGAHMEPKSNFGAQKRGLRTESSILTPFLSPKWTLKTDHFGVETEYVFSTLIFKSFKAFLRPLWGPSQCQK